VWFYFQAVTRKAVSFRDDVKGENTVENFSLTGLYVVGDELLDAQHKVILNYMAKVYAYLLAANKGDELFGLINRLDTYCRLHFLDEEKLMEEIKLPEIEAHKAQHALFVTHLENFMGRYEEADSVKNIDELVFLKGWFMEHIQVFDKRYAEFGKSFD
jgi:hemerythrin